MMKKKVYTIVMFFSFLIVPLSVMAQDMPEVVKKIADKKGNPVYIKYSAKSTKLENLQDIEKKAFLKNALKNKENEDWKLKQKGRKDKNGFTTDKYQLYYKKLPVEYHIYSVHEKNDTLVSLSGFYEDIGSIDTKPALTNDAALDSALNEVKAEKYIWQADKSFMFEDSPELKKPPKGSLVIYKNPFTGDSIYHLAYSFEILSVKPFDGYKVYVEAHTGEILFKEPLIHNSSIGSADTRYSGNQDIHTTYQENGKYNLYYENSYFGVNTVDEEHSASTQFYSEFEDSDNNWTSQEYDNANKDNGALDAHFAGYLTLSYFKEQFDRNSYDDDGAIAKLFVHYGSNVENARWFYSVLQFGDGGTTYFNSDIWTSLDIVAHEIAHAVCEYSCDLVEFGEPGAINEGLSDIWGACVENYANNEGYFNQNKNIWRNAEDAFQNANQPYLRNLQNPKENLTVTGAQPDTYEGQYWSNDLSAVHTNMSIMNKWFYILTQGESGANDHNYNYNVSGIGIDKAADIVYRAETAYIRPIDGYRLIRTWTIEAATDLYGSGSTEVNAVKDSWNAVGVYNSSDEKCFSPEQIANTTFNFECEVVNLFGFINNSDVSVSATKEINFFEGFFITHSTFEANVE